MEKKEDIGRMHTAGLTIDFEYGELWRGLHRSNPLSFKKPFSFLVYKDRDKYMAEDWRGRIRFEDDDASEVIQSVVSEIEKEEGGSIMFQSGRYVIDKNIRCPTNLEMVGVGRVVFDCREPPSVSIEKEDGSTYDVKANLVFEPEEGYIRVHIKNIIFEGLTPDPANPVPQVPLVCALVRGTIENCDFINAGQSCAFVYGKNITIKDCYFYNSRQHLLEVSGYNIVVKDSEFDTNTGDETTPRPLLSISNEFMNVTSNRNIKIENCDVHDASGAGIEVVANVDVDMWNIKVVDCEIHDNGRQGIVIGSDGGAIRRCKIMHNEIHDHSDADYGYGIFFSVNYANVRHIVGFNEIYNSGVASIRSPCSWTLFLGNRLYDSPKYADDSGKNLLIDDFSVNDMVRMRYKADLYLDTARIIDPAQANASSVGTLVKVIKVTIAGTEYYIPVYDSYS